MANTSRRFSTDGRRDKDAKFKADHLEGRSMRRRARVIVPSNGDEVHLNQVMVDQNGLTVLTVPGEEVEKQIPFDLIQGWWLDNEEEMTVIVTDEASASSSAQSSSGGKGGKTGSLDAASVTKEVRLKSKRAQDIVDCMQEVVTNLLQERHNQSAPASPASNDGANERPADASDGGHAQAAVGDPAEAVGNTDNDKGKGAGTSGYVFLKSGFLQKRREKFPYRWKERYFILERQSNGKHTLQYFEDKESSKDPNRELGAVDLSTISNVVRYTDGPFLSFSAFQMNKTRDRRFLLKAPTLHVRNEWATKIESLL